MARRNKKHPALAQTAQTAKTTVAPQAMLQPSHDAAGNGRRLRGWSPASTGPNRANTGAPSIRNRARDVVRNDWAGSAIINRWASNLVGTGIIARPKTTDAALKTKINDLWDDWQQVCDADGTLDLYGLQNMVARNWIAAGEVFIRLRPRFPQDGLPVSLQLQVLEADMVPAQDSTAPNGNEIAQGIEFDRLGRRVAYWMHRNHPGDGRSDTGQLVRIPADTVLHIFEPLRPGQLRGISELAPVLTKLRSVGNFDDSVLHRQELSNLFAGFVERTPSVNDRAIDPITGQTIQTDTSGVPMVAMEPGTMQELLPGETVKFSDPPDAGANYADFTRAQYQLIAAGTGLPYELLTGDLRDISDRALRVIIQEFRRLCQQRQWHILIPQLCQKVRNAWADAAVLDGALTTEEGKTAKRVNWVPQGWAYIHPLQDIQAQKIAVENGLSSRNRVITERGDDPEQIDAERADDYARAESLGLNPKLTDPNADPVKQAEAAKANAEKDVAQANARLLDRQADRQNREALATIEKLKAEARRANADAALNLAKAGEAEANAALISARQQADAAEAAQRLADAQAVAAQTANESAARIAALEANAAQAAAESSARASALQAAETAAQTQREIVIQAERTRAEIAQLEKQAAELGLAELKGQP